MVGWWLTNEKCFENDASHTLEINNKNNKRIIIKGYKSNIHLSGNIGNITGATETYYKYWKTDD